MTASERKDTWASGAAYEPYVGRWSRLVAREFLAWLAIRPGACWLDIGCGTGALSQTILEVVSPRLVVGVDPSQGYIAFAREQIQDTRADFLLGDAQALPVSSSAYDIVVSGLVLNLELPVMRLLEGYWPRILGLSALRHLAVRFQNWRVNSKEARWQILEKQRDQGQLTPEEDAERVDLDVQLRQTPDQPGERMPTRLGNILRAAEIKPRDRYGLDTIICWPRLWLLLPAEAKNELSDARATLDTAVGILIWGILFIIWTIWAWWALLVGLVVAIWAYGWLLQAAIVYGDLLVSAFDLHRSALYGMLRLSLPEDPVAEKKLGEQLTNYLFRGELPATVKFQNADDKKKSP